MAKDRIQRRLAALTGRLAAPTEPKASISYVGRQSPIPDAEDMAHVLDGLLKAGLPE